MPRQLLDLAIEQQTAVTPRAIPQGTSEDFTLSDVFARQQSIPLELPDTIAVVGCGGVGSWIAYFLALAGCPRLILFDSDNVSDHNLNRMPYGPGSIGKPKNESLKLLILASRPNCKVECYPNFDTKFATTLGFNQTGHEIITWMVVSTDTWVSRQEAYHYCKNYGIYYIEAAAEGEFGSIAGSPAEWGTDEETQPGYASVPVWIGPAVAAAVMACDHILHGNIHVDINARFGWDGDRIRLHYRGESHNESVIDREFEDLRVRFDPTTAVTDGMAYAGENPTVAHEPTEEADGPEEADEEVA